MAPMPTAAPLFLNNDLWFTSESLTEVGEYKLIEQSVTNFNLNSLSNIMEN